MLQDLEKLRLMDTKLNGEIPKGIGELSKLTNFYVFSDSFGGKLPPKMGSNGLLQRLDISRNSLQGSMPMYICRGNNLVTLNLFNNKLNNTLPTITCQLQLPHQVCIESKNFTGSIPQALTMLPNFLIYI